MIVSANAKIERKDLCVMLYELVMASRLRIDASLLLLRIAAFVTVSPPLSLKG